MKKNSKKKKHEDVLLSKGKGYIKRFTVEKIQEIASRLESPEYQEERMKDIRAIIRSVKDPESITRGVRLKAAFPEKREEETPRESEIKIPTTMAHNIGFMETMARPRAPDFDETESETSCERLSMDSDTDLSPSLLELVKTDEEAEEDKSGKKTTEKEKKVILLEVPEAEVPNEKNKSQEHTLKPKPKLKRWKPKFKKSPIKLDPMFMELTEGVSNYLNEVGVLGFMKAWVEHLYALNPRPKNPVKDLQMLLQDAFGVSQTEIDISVLEKELQDNLRKEDDIRVETSKLLHLCHLLAPEIYDSEGDFIPQEASVEEEAGYMGEERSESQTAFEHLVVSSRSKRGSKRRLKKGRGKKEAGSRSIISKISIRSKRERIPRVSIKKKALPPKTKKGK